MPWLLLFIVMLLITEAEQLLKKCENLIPRQMFDVAIQAAIG